MAIGHFLPGGISFHAHRATELASAELYTP